MRKLYAIILSFGLILAPVHHAKAEMSWGGVTNMVAGISTGIIGSTILVKCKAGAAHPSLWAFMAGALTYIVAEIVGANALQAHIKAESLNLEEAKKKLQEGDSLQRIALEQQLSSETEKLNYVKKRKGWTYAVGIFYLLASTLAIVEAVISGASLGTYTGLGICTEFGETKALNGFIRGALIIAFMGGSLNSAGTGPEVSIIGGLASSIFLITKVSEFMETVIGPMVETPVGRSITFGSFTALTAASIIDLEMTQTTIEKNIDDLNLVLRTQYPTTVPTGVETGPSPESVGGSVSPIATNGKVKTLDGFYAITTTQCTSNTGGSFSVNSANCKKPFKVNRPVLTGGLSNNLLQNTINTAADYTDALASGNMAKAEVLAGSLSSMAARLKKEKEKALKKYNQVAKEKNKKILDFDKEVKAFSESMSGKLSKSLASQGIDPKSMTKASVGGDKKPLAAVGTVATPVTAAPEVPLEDLSTTTETPPEETAQAPAPTLEKSLEEFESNESDISPQKQVSIFKQVSNRYILNFNRFFKEEEPITEAPAPAESKDSPPAKPVTQPVR